MNGEERHLRDLGQPPARRCSPGPPDGAAHRAQSAGAWGRLAIFVPWWRSSSRSEAHAPAPDALQVAVRQAGLEPATAKLSSEDLVRRMLGHGRGALLLRTAVASHLTDAQRTEARAALRRRMALIAPGPVRIEHPLWDGSAEEMLGAVATGVSRQLEVDEFWLDRLVVSNADYQHFVDAGGYRLAPLWEPEVQPLLGEFVDATGRPGPRFWQHGRHRMHEADLPVCGISRYEAAAYAAWVGKRLPSDAEWLRAAVQPTQLPDGGLCQRRFPWGEELEEMRVNARAAGGAGRVVPADALPAGDSPQGVRQLCGNVWEWTADPFGPALAGKATFQDVRTGQPLCSIRGAAADAYFELHVEAAFQSGERALARRRNLGFRCALSACDLFEDAAPAATRSAAGPRETA